MRFLTLLALSLVSLALHRAYATTLPTLCTAEEKPLISGETPRGFASLCAGKNDIWHYRFGEPEHITYVFPRDNSPAKKNFSSNILNYQRNQGGSIFAFRDHGREIYIFDARTTVWGNQRNIIGKMAGIRIKDPKRQHVVDLPFTRLTPGGETSWGINRKPPFASAVTEQIGILFNHNNESFSDGYSDSTIYFLYQFHPSIAKYHLDDVYTGAEVDYTPFFLYNSYNEFEKTFLVFTQKSSISRKNWPLAAYNRAIDGENIPQSLCSPTEKIIISGRTARGNFASLCADGVYWQYRFGKPGHLTDTYPLERRPAREVFDYTLLPTFRKGDMMISGHVRFRFKKNDTTLSLFSATEQLADDDEDEGLHSNDDSMMSTHGGIVIQRPHQRPSYIPFDPVDYDALCFVASPKTDPHIPPLPAAIMAQEPRDVTHSAPFTIPSAFLDP